MTNTGSGRVNPTLLNQMLSRPDEELPIMVTFTIPLTADVVTDLGLSGEGTTATGVLGHDAILALAARPDVLRIEYRPEYFPSLF